MSTPANEQTPASYTNIVNEGKVREELTHMEEIGNSWNIWHVHEVALVPEEEEEVSDYCRLVDERGRMMQESLGPIELRAFYHERHVAPSR